MKVTHLSLWNPARTSSPRIKLRRGIVSVADEYTRISLPEGYARMQGLPKTVVGWRVFASRRTDDGEFHHVYEGTITVDKRVSDVAGRRRVFHCDPAKLREDI